MNTLHADSDNGFMVNLKTTAMSALASEVMGDHYTDAVEMNVTHKYLSNGLRERIPGGETVMCTKREDVTDSYGFLVAVIYYPEPNVHFTKLIIYNN